MGKVMDLAGVPEDQIDWEVVMEFLDDGGEVINGPDDESGMRPAGMLQHEREELERGLTTRHVTETPEGKIVSYMGFMSWIPNWMRGR